jgi:hypothetical protein
MIQKNWLINRKEWEQKYENYLICAPELTKQREVIRIRM